MEKETKRKWTCFFLLGIFALASTPTFAGWETGAKVGYDSNVNRAVDGRDSDSYLNAYLSWGRSPSGESRLDWTLLAILEGAAFAKFDDLDSVALTLAPGLTLFPFLNWSINFSPFIQGKAVSDSDQSALTLGAKVILNQRISKNVYSGQYYIYKDSRADEDVYSYVENALGIFLGVNWTRAFFTEVGYEYSHGDSFSSITTTTTIASGRGKNRRFSTAFGTDVVREKVDRHSFGITAGVDLTKSIFSQIAYTYSAVDGELGSYPIHVGSIGLGYRF